MHSPTRGNAWARDNRLQAAPRLRKGTTGALELLSLLAALSPLTACGPPASSVHPSGPVPLVTVSCSSGSIHTGDRVQCTATETGTGSGTSAVNWSVNGVRGGNSTVGTISPDGIYTAPSSVLQQRNFTVSAQIGTVSNGSFSVTGITVTP